MKGVESRACGVHCYFPFVYTFYEEGGIRNFGMMGREVTPLRSMAAYACAVHCLSGMDYLGDLEGVDPAIRLARVFGESIRHTPCADGQRHTECAGYFGGKRLIVLYTGKVQAGADGPARSARRAYRGHRRPAAGAFRRRHAADPRRHDLRLVPPPRRIAKRLKTATPAMELYVRAWQPAPPPRPASAIVLHYVFSRTPCRTSAQRYLLDEATARSLPITVRIFNLSSSAEQVTAELQLPVGPGCRPGPERTPLAPREAGSSGGKEPRGA